MRSFPRHEQPESRFMSEAAAGGSGYTALLTDLYHFTMLDSYYRLGMQAPAVFEFSVRRLPDTRNFLVAAGLEPALDYLESLHFTAEEIAWLASTGRFSTALLDRLGSFRFTGSVYAMPEGTVFFANQPVLRVIAPLPEAQFIESRLINLLHYHTIVASKAARARLVAPHAQLIDFGMRRAHGAEAAGFAARASYIAGFDATATVEAARRYGVPAVGTMAHSFVQAHVFEMEAFRNFARCQPGNITLLIDTYDIARAAHRAAELDRTLREEGLSVKAVRIDSGDLAAESQRVRDILDAHACEHIRILVSGGLDEYVIAQLLEAQAPIDGYCLGTRLTASDDAPTLDCVYKLHQYADRPVRKRSQWKESWPGPRQVYRQYDEDGRIEIDVLGCADESIEGRSLLREVMIHGRRLCQSPTLDEVRAYCKDELATLPQPLLNLHKVGPSPVKVSARQRALAEAVDRVMH
jgi:nicotinate phosphoribosyltransferase